MQTCTANASWRNYESERRELADIYVGRGLTRYLAQRVADL